jgi:predicted membrane channel-forming protein YqfA (hemolysin III family)
MAFFSISLVKDLGILRDIYPFSAMGYSHHVINLCTLCGIYERYEAQWLNNHDYMPVIKLINSSIMSFLFVCFRDDMNEWKEN